MHSLQGAGFGRVWLTAGPTQHTHMNSTKWSSLTEFAKYLGNEGICRVEENDKGIHIAWIDTSPEAIKRQELLRRKEAQDRETTSGSSGC